MSPMEKLLFSVDMAIEDIRERLSALETRKQQVLEELETYNKIHQIEEPSKDKETA